MKTRSAGWCLGVLLLIGTLTAAEAADITQVGSWMPLGSPAHDLVIEGDRAYVVTDLGLTVVNIANPAAPVIQGSVKLGGKGYGVAVKGDYAYAVNISTDLKVVRVSNAGIPVAPEVKATLTLPGAAWDVAVKDDVAYVASMGGELYLVDISDPLHPRQIKVIGLLAWSSPGSDVKSVTKLTQYVTAGSAKATGVSVSGDHLLTFDWNYGRAYYYDVTDARNPRFAGTHYVPFAFRGEVNPAGTTAFILTAYAATSGIYSVPLSLMETALVSFKSTYHASCQPPCDYAAVPQTDNGGMGISANGKYVMYIAGKQGQVGVINVENPSNMVLVDSYPIPAHGSKLAQSMGVAEYRDDYFIAAGGVLGLGVFRLPGLSAPLSD